MDPVTPPEWDPHRLPDLTGRAYLVTGATAGLGFFACAYGGPSGNSLLLCAAPDFYAEQRQLVPEALLFTVEL